MASGFETEDVAGEVKGADLAAPVAEQTIAANRAAHDLVDVLGRLALAEDAFVAAVSEFGGDEFGMAGEQRAVGGVARKRLTPILTDGRGSVRLVEHGAISWIRATPAI